MLLAYIIYVLSRPTWGDLHMYVNSRADSDTSILAEVLGVVWAKV